MNGRFSSYQVSLWLDDLAARTIYLALFTADPFTVSDPLTVELTSTSVAREESVWERTSPYSLELANDVFFQAIPPETTLVALGGFDAEVNGNLLFRDLMSYSGQVGQPLHMLTGGSFSIATGEMVIGMDIPESAA